MQTLRDGAETAAAAAAADGKCAWIFQWDWRKRWRIVGGLMRCVYTLTAWLFRNARGPLLYICMRQCHVCWVSISLLWECRVMRFIALFCKSIIHQSKEKHVAAKAS